MPYLVSLHERVSTTQDTEPGRAVPSKNSKRGQVSGISRKSRFRLIRLLAKVSRPDECLFITLTYRDFCDDFETWKKHLNTFGVGLKYQYPDLAAIWRLEFQTRGAPHFHILAWLAADTNLAALRDDLSRRWCRIIGQESKANFEYGVKVEPVQDFRQTAFYISLYQSKDSQDRDDIATGREWGCWNREGLGLEPVETFKLTTAQHHLYRRVLRRNYRRFLRATGQGDYLRIAGRGVVRPYLRALRTAQPFSTFLPFAVSRGLLKWIVETVPGDPF